MRKHLLLAPALFTVALLCASTKAQDVPGADKAIEKSVKDLKTARDLANNPAEKERLSEAIAALEKVTAKKGPADTKKKVYTRAEFKNLVVGRSKEQIKQLLGKPEKTTELNSVEYNLVWHYKNVTKDPDAEKIDPDANILFDVQGIAVSVDYLHFPF